MTNAELRDLAEALETVAEILECSLDEVLNCLKGDLISEEEAGELRYGI